MIELIVTLTIVGIMAAVVFPRMNFIGTFDARGHADQLASWLRFAQKSALAGRRMVSLDLSTATPTLRQSSSTSCSTTASSGTAMNGPAKWRTPNSTTSLTNGLGNTICFDGTGRPYATAALTSTQSIVVKDSGQVVSTIYVEAETGYIHD
jgi:MSHA pilin protein MshC